MCPDACRQRIVDAQADDDPEEMLYAASDMLWWLSRGGHPPKDMTREGTIRWATDVKNEAKRRLFG